MSKQRMIIVSLDAVGRQDMEYLMTLPNFSKLMSQGAFCDNVETVYPSLTYPAHASIVTGRTPSHHSIVANTLFQPGRKTPDWMYKRKYIRGTTLVDEAKKKGMSVACFLWPVMGGARVDYNIPEVMVTRKWQNQVTVCLANGTPLFLLDMNKRFGHLRKGISQPELDNFLTACAEDTIFKHNPDLTLIHYTDVDTNRHLGGVRGEHIREALDRHDERLGRLINSLEATGDMENTTIVVLGDHCQMDTHTIVYLNAYFKEKGYLETKNGVITDYKLICRSLDGAAYIYLNPKYSEDSDMLSLVTDFLNEMKKDEKLGIEEVYTASEAKEMGASGECLVMLEAKRGFYFLDETDVVSEPVSETKNHKMLAAHGYLPAKEENKSFFLMSGYGVKQGARLDRMSILDEGPTLAKILEVNLGLTDGRAKMEFLSRVKSTHTQA